MAITGVLAAVVLGASVATAVLGRDAAPTLAADAAVTTSTTTSTTTTALVVER